MFLSMLVLMPIAMVMLCIIGNSCQNTVEVSFEFFLLILYDIRCFPEDVRCTVYKIYLLFKLIFFSIVDSILGALSLPDIGQLFPDNDPNWKGADSSIFMEEVTEFFEQVGTALLMRLWKQHPR